MDQIHSFLFYFFANSLCNLKNKRNKWIELNDNNLTVFDKNEALFLFLYVRIL